MKNEKKCHNCVFQQMLFFQFLQVARKKKKKKKKLKRQKKYTL